MILQGLFFILRSQLNRSIPTHVHIPTPPPPSSHPRNFWNRHVTDTDPSSKSTNWRVRPSALPLPLPESSTHIHVDPKSSPQPSTPARCLANSPGKLKIPRKKIYIYLLTLGNLYEMTNTPFNQCMVKKSLPELQTN